MSNYQSENYVSMPRREVLRVKKMDLDDITHMAHFSQDMELNGKIIFKEDGDYPILLEDKGKMYVGYNWAPKNKECCQFDTAEELPFKVVPSDV